MLPNHLFNQTITLYNRSAYDGYGKESYGSGSSQKARIQLTSKPTYEYSVEGIDATQYIISAIMYLKSTVTVTEGDKITFGSNNYRVHSVKPAIDGEGNTNHIRVDCTKWNI